MAEDTTVTIAIKANVEAFKKSMQEARRSMKDTGKSISNEAQKVSEDIKAATDTKKGGFAQFAESFKGVSPMFDSVAGSISDMGARFKGAGKAGKLAMAGIGAAVGGLALGIGVMLGKAIMDTTGKLAKLADPARFDKASTEMKESLRTLKTSIGELASPIFEYMAKGVSALAQGLTWVVERIQMFVGLLQGLLGLGHKVNQTLNGTAEGMEEAGSAADAGLASFDKLTTLNVGEMGDMEQAKKMAKAMDDMRKKGAEMAKSIKGAFKPLTDGVAKLKEIFSMSPGEMWDKFKESAGNAWESIKNVGSSVWEGLKGVVTGYWDFVGNLAHNVWEGIKNIGSTIWEGLKSVVTGYWDFVGNAGRTIWNGLKDHVTKIFTTVADTLKGVFKGVVDVFKGAWDKAYGAIKGAIDWILGKIKWILDKIEGVKDFFGGIGDKVKDTFGSIGDKVKGALGIKAKDEPVADKGPSRTEQVRDQYMKAMMDHPEYRDALAKEYSKLASTIVPKSDAIPSLSMGPLAGSPSLSKDDLADVLRQVQSETPAYAKATKQDITLTLDGRVLARYLYDDLETEGSRRGSVIY